MCLKERLLICTADSNIAGVDLLLYIHCIVQEPEIFKLVSGGTLGLLVTPIMACAALIAKGRQAVPSPAN